MTTEKTMFLGQAAIEQLIENNRNEINTAEKAAKDYADKIVVEKAKSAYDIAVDNGFKGNEVEWLESLKGETGAQGEQGIQGEKGEKGENGAQGPQGEKGEKGIQGEKGVDGVSVSIASISESAEDGGSNVITFSDGKTVTIKNGSAGTTTDTNPIPDYWLPALQEGARTINETLCEAGKNKSAFLFYTDVHWNYGSQMSPTLLKYLYKNTSITKTFFGGDIVQNESTDYDAMSYLWDWRKQLKDLPNHHSVVGNHDDGNATNNLFSEQYVYGYLFAAEETPHIVRGKRGMYYYIDNGAENTRYLFLDTAYRGVDDDQQDFVKQALITTPSGWHVIAVSHIWYDVDWTDTSNPVVGNLNSDASILLSMFDNYNSRNGEYSECEGWVEFCIGGHTHCDYNNTSTTGIPIILVETDSRHTRSGLTYTAGTTTESSVNGIIADYSKHKIFIVRIGRGENRTIDVTNYVITYTNVLPLATTNDKVTVYNEEDTPGYKADTRWSNSQVAEIAATGKCITGYIPISGGNTIYLENVTMPNTSDSTVLLWKDDISGKYVGAQNADQLTTHYSPVWGEDGNLKQFTLPSTSEFKYMRIVCTGISPASVITINEPIN